MKELSGWGRGHQEEKGLDICSKGLEREATGVLCVRAQSPFGTNLGSGSGCYSALGDEPLG